MSIEQRRRNRRAVTSASRREYRFKANQYNLLGNKSKTKPSDFRYTPETTIHDILQSMKSSKDRQVVRRRASVVSRVIGDIQVSDEVRAAWQAKFGQRGLTDQERQKLIEMARPQLKPNPSDPKFDELKLIALAEAIVRTWVPRNKLT